MKSRWLLLILCAGLFLGGFAFSQAPPPSEKVRSKAVAALSQDTRSQQTRQLYEEIEIMRRILDRNLKSLPGLAMTHSDHVLSLAFSPDGKQLISGKSDGTVRIWDVHSGKQLSREPHTSPDLLGPQGVYLKGQGVVYTLTMPWHFQPPVSDPKQPAAKPLTEWERLLKEIRGEKVEPEKGSGHDVSIADAVLKVLAENGRHFSQLAENESLTVAITLSRNQTCAQCHMMKSTTISSSGSNSGTSTSVTKTGEADAKKLPAEIGKELANRKNEARKQVLLGELHHKQEKYPQAVEAYQEALKGYQQLQEFRRRFSLDLHGTLPEKDVQLELEMADIYNKLTQTYLAMGNRDKAQETLQAMADHTRRASQPDPAKPAARPAPVVLPAKLIISAPKKLLDVMGTGKLTFEEFKKTATVEYLDFAPAEKEAPK